MAGRARDVEELKHTKLPVSRPSANPLANDLGASKNGLQIWARGLSTVGAGAGSVPWATQVPLEVDGTNITPGDLAFSDPINGVVIIPRDKVIAVLELLPRLTSADEKVKEEVLQGMTVHEAFKLHRSNL